jgi:hypothetical protein
MDCIYHIVSSFILGYTVISVGIGADIYSDELVDIASSPSQFFKVIDFASLSNIIAELRDRICQGKL